MYIVTGASSGIGQASALALASRDLKVVAVGRNLTNLHSLQNQYPDQIKVVQADISTAHGIAAIVDAVNSSTSVDGIVHAAGSSVPLTKYESMTLQDSVEEHVSVHVTAPIALNNALNGKLNGSRILFIDSYSANSPRVGWAAYSIVKAAAQMAIRCAQAELKTSNVIRLFPGGVRTPLVETVLRSTDQSEVVDTFKKLDIESKLLTPETVGSYIANLLVDASVEQLASRSYWELENPNDQLF